MNSSRCMKNKLFTVYKTIYFHSFWNSFLRGIDPYDRNERFCLGAIRNINRDFNDEKRKTTHIRNHLGQKDKCLVFSRDSKGKGKVLNSIKRLNENFKFGLRTEMLKVFRFLFKVEI